MRYNLKNIQYEILCIGKIIFYHAKWVSPKIEEQCKISEFTRREIFVMNMLSPHSVFREIRCVSSYYDSRIVDMGKGVLEFYPSGRQKIDGDKKDYRMHHTCVSELEASFLVGQLHTAIIGYNELIEKLP